MMWRMRIRKLNRFARRQIHSYRQRPKSRTTVWTIHRFGYGVSGAGELVAWGSSAVVVQEQSTVTFKASYFGVLSPHALVPSDQLDPR